MPAAVQTSVIDTLKSAQNASDGSLNVVAISGSTTAVTGTVTTQSKVSATATLSNVNDSATSVTVLAANANRLGAMFYNDSTVALYLKMGATASTTSFTVKIASQGYYELPTTSVYTGILDGIWDSDASGAVRVTELTA